MKIAILGSAPSSLHLAPHGDHSWKVWGCSPGVYHAIGHVNAWFELHRWEPGVVGKAATQKPWFSPEYVEWMARLVCPVWMYDRVPEIPASARLPIEDLKAKYGTYFFTSTPAIMMACAIEDILEDREKRKAAAQARAAAGLQLKDDPADEPDVIGLWGIDMAATEEYGYQRAGCQHFLLLASQLGIEIMVPPESDLLRPMPVYGLCESSHWHIKGTIRRRELENRLANAKAAEQNIIREIAFISGALDDHNYHMQTWMEDRDGMGTSLNIRVHDQEVRQHILDTLPAVKVAPQ